MDATVWVLVGVVAALVMLLCGLARKLAKQDVELQELRLQLSEAIRRRILAEAAMSQRRQAEAKERRRQQREAKKLERARGVATERAIDLEGA